MNLECARDSTNENFANIYTLTLGSVHVGVIVTNSFLLAGGYNESKNRRKKSMDEENTRIRN